jgi:glycosyltransferase involved in cell wall biosynthesis
MLSLMAERYDVVHCETKSGLLASNYGATQAARYRELLEADGVEVFDGKPEAALRSKRFGIVLFEYYHVARSLLRTARMLQPRAKMVVDSVDAQFRRFFAEARLKRSPRRLWRAIKVWRRELRVYRLADLVIAVTEEDRRAIARACPGVPVQIIPNIHALPRLPSSAEKRPASLVFVGWFGHGPNVDAMVWFVRNVLPRVADRVPDVHLDIVGGDPPDEIRSLASSRIRVTGWVPETATYILASEISVAPLRFGAGMKGKIGEALALGIPVVTTSIGAEGLGLVDGQNALVADDEVGIAERLVTLLGDPDLRRRIGSAGRARISDLTSPEAVGPRLEKLLSDLCAQPRSADAA